MDSNGNADLLGDTNLLNCPQYIIYNGEVITDGSMLTPTQVNNNNIDANSVTPVYNLNNNQGQQPQVSNTPNNYDLRQEPGAIELDSLSVASSDSNPFRRTNLNPFTPVSQAADSTIHVTAPSVDSQINKLVGAVNELVLSSKIKKEKVPIAHIDTFSGEGSSTNVAIKLNYFISDFNEACLEKNLSEHEKMVLAKQKLTGAARALVATSRPQSYSDLIKLLKSSFGDADGPHEDLLQQLKSIKIQDSQNFIQLSTKAKELAILAAERLQCQISSRIIFEAFALGILSNFQSYIKVQDKVRQAINMRDCDELTSVLQSLLKTDKSILIKSEKADIKKISFSNNNSQNIAKSTPQIKCQLCMATNHTAIDCPKWKELNTKNESNNQMPTANNQNHYQRREYNYNPRFGHGYPQQQFFDPYYQYGGRTPRFYMPRHPQGYNQRSYTPSMPPQRPHNSYNQNKSQNFEPTQQNNQSRQNFYQGRDRNNQD